MYAAERRGHPNAAEGGPLMAEHPRRRKEDQRATTLEHLLAAKEIAIVCGSGGVGKTTTAAAAAAMAATSLGGKVLVVTVDPARRLANALGLEGFGNQEKPVPTDAFRSPFLRWLTAPARSRLINFATRPFYQIADRILGTQFLQDISEFFLAFQPMYDGFVERAEAVDRLLHDRRTTFVVVSTLEHVPPREAEFFIDALSDQRFHLGALVLNKVLPDYLLDPGATRVAPRLCAEAPESATKLESLTSKPEQLPTVLHEVGESYLNFQVVAKRESEQRAELSTCPTWWRPCPTSTTTSTTSRACSSS